MQRILLFFEFIIHINVRTLSEDVWTWVCESQIQSRPAYNLVVFIFWNINHHIHTTCADFKRNCKREKIVEKNEWRLKYNPFSVSDHTLLLWIYAQDALTVSDRNGRTEQEMERARARSMTESMLLRSTYYYSFESASVSVECARAANTCTRHSHTSRWHWVQHALNVLNPRTEPNTSHNIFFILHFRTDTKL